ncbi:MAG: FCD domain-containing protein [Hyphomicrobiaceae bacterium]|nr:FCD domain-containing protein [Hyphomicrobiaceae bacterium]
MLTISDLVAAYGETRGRVQRACERAANEGWLEKGGGYKWSVRLGIASEDDYARFYRFRETIEPAAVLEPGFEIDQQEFRTLLSLQKRIANGEFEALSAVDLFEINTELHETIVSWSGNHFYLDALKRANASRRVIEYTKVLETERIDIFAHEHVEILETLERGARKKAARLIQAHVSTAGNVKATSLSRPSNGNTKK